MPNRADERAPLPRQTLITLGLWVLSLLVLQYRSLPKFRFMSMRHNRFESFWANVERLVELTWEDALWFGLPVLLFALLIYLEARKGQLSQVLARAFSSERLTWLLLGITVPVLTRYYFAAGETNWVGDGAAHLAYARAAALGIAGWEWPIWSNAIGFGTPYLQFYGFLYFYFVGLLDLFVADLFLTVKLSMFLGHLASAAGMYVLARTVCRSRAAGYLGALAYTLSFWHVQQVLLMGRFPISLFYALLPWPFYFFERLRLPRQRRRAVVGGGLTLGLLPFVHPGYGFWAMVFFGVYAGLRLLLTPRLRSAGLLAHAGLLAGVAVLFSAYLTLPMWLERGATGIVGGIDLSGVGDPSWRQLFYWSNMLFPAPFLDLEVAHWYGGYLGISLVVLALVGAGLTFGMPVARRHLPHVAAGVCLALTFLIVLGYRWSALQALPVVRALNAGRYLLFTVFLLALLAAVGGAALRNWRGGGILRSRRGGSRRWRTLCLPLLFVLADLGPTTVQQPYTTGDQELTWYPTELLEFLREEEKVDEYASGELPAARLFASMAEVHPFLASTWIMYRTGLPTPQADHRLLLPSMHAFAGPFERYLNWLVRTLDDSRVEAVMSNSPVVQAGLQLLDARHLLVAVPEKGTVSLVNPVHSPILVSSRIAGHPALEEMATPSEEIVEKILLPVSSGERPERLKELFPVVRLIQKTGVRVGTSRCEQIPIVGMEEERDLGTEPVARLLNQRVWNQRVELRVHTSAPCFARLAYAHFPSLEVRADGRRVEPMRTAGGFMALELPAGVNWITIEARLSTLRRILLGLDGLLLCLGAWVLARERRR